MTLAMTVMVRDEADIIGAMIRHHLAQGVDHIIATDNGSVDGTREILAGFVSTGKLELRDDPVHRKQQSTRVTEMARDAYTRYGADWVINADADEFWVAADPTKTLAEVFAHIPKSIQSFTVDVTDMTGPAAQRGTGLQRLVYEDRRDAAQLAAAGLLAHATPDAVHIGIPDINVSQGNHLVSLESKGRPAPEDELRVFHYPWRSWEQFRRKVDNAGRAYESQTELTPSPNHHGMRDYRRLKAGTLLGHYLLRHPDVEGGELDGLVLNRRIADAVESPVPDEMLDRGSSTVLRAAAASENTSALEVQRLQGRLDELEPHAERLQHELDRVNVELDDAIGARNGLAELSNRLRAQLDELGSEVAELRSRKVVRAADAISRIAHSRTR